MAVVDAAIFEALWRHTVLIKYAKPNIMRFQQYLAIIFMDVQF